MAPGTRPAAAPEMAPTVLELLTAGRFDDLASLPSSEIENAERDLNRRHHELLAERDALQGPDPTLSEAAVVERAGREREVERLIGHVQSRQDVLARARKTAAAREADQAGEAFALTAQPALLAALEAAEAASAAYKHARGELEVVAGRLLDPRVRRRLQVDPTSGLRGRLLALLPASHQLAHMERAGESLVPSSGPERWPSFVTDGGQDMRLEGAERIRDRVEYLRWRTAMGRVTLPAGCQAARVLAELEQKFG